MSNLFDLALGDKAGSDRLAIDAGGQGRLSFAELIEATGRMASAIRVCGVQPGDRVAVQVEKSLANLVLYLACLRAGAVFLPLNTAYTLAELGYFVSDAEPRLIVCDPKVREGVAESASGVGARVETLNGDGRGSLADLAAAQSAAFETVPRADDDLAAIVYT